MSWSADYWEARTELERLGLWRAKEAPRKRSGVRSKQDGLVALRQRIALLDELGADVKTISGAVGKHRATVRYHLREIGARKEPEL